MEEDKQFSKCMWSYWLSWH